MDPLDPVISASELASRAGEFILVDARSGPEASRRYGEAHLVGARFVDLDRNLARIALDARRGGRHPLPPIADFAAFLGTLGIDRESDVVVYDDQGGANAAARFWWMLRALGHERVRVLDGGLQAARTAGMLVTMELPRPFPFPPYPTDVTEWPGTVDLEEVAAAAGDTKRLVLDVRSPARFRGESEPIDPVAGHIPGARNAPLSENLTATGAFKDPSVLRALYEAHLDGRSPDRLIVHCGSGVTACHTLLALERAGLSGAKLYVGSFSEWCRQTDRLIAEGDT